jgi:multiple sugar transport system substrate-binding protein
MRKLGVTSMSMKTLLLGLSAITIASVAAGCSDGVTGKDAKDTPQPSKVQPLTLSVYDGIFTEPEYKDFVEKPVKEKFPHITLERSTLTTTNDPITNLSNMVNAGNVPDLVLMPIYFNQQMEDLKLPADLNPYIQKNKLDMTLFDPLIVKELPRITLDNRITLLPLYKDIAVTVYNKDIFDKFGVEYPKDGMTYDEMMATAKKIARSDNGLQYIGMFPGAQQLQARQLSLDVLDKNNKSVVSSLEGYKKVFQLQKDIYGIPGSDILKGNQNFASDHFFKQQDLGIFVEWITKVVKPIKAGAQINWDMVTMPVFADKPDVHSSLEFHGVYMSEGGKHKDESFAVLSHLTTSRDIQAGFSRIGRVPAHRDQALIKEFGSELMKGKNVDAIAKTKMAPLNNRSKWDNVGKVTNNPINAALLDVFNGKDINTALREASELIDKNVQAELGK